MVRWGMGRRSTGAKERARDRPVAERTAVTDTRRRVSLIAERGDRHHDQADQADHHQRQKHGNPLSALAQGGEGRGGYAPRRSNCKVRTECLGRKRCAFAEIFPNVRSPGGVRTIPFCVSAARGIALRA